MRWASKFHLVARLVAPCPIRHLGVVQSDRAIGMQCADRVAVGVEVHCALDDLAGRANDKVIGLGRIADVRSNGRL